MFHHAFVQISELYDNKWKRNHTGGNFRITKEKLLSNVKKNDPVT